MGKVVLVRETRLPCYGGTLNQFLGDGFMALFGAPLTLEDRARHGVLAALQESLCEHQEDFERLQVEASRRVSHTAGRWRVRHKEQS